MNAFFVKQSIVSIIFEIKSLRSVVKKQKIIRENREKIMTENQSRYGRRSVALFWLVLVSIIIGVLIYLEQIALLYVLATLSLVALLLVVGFADLEKVNRDNIEGFAGKVE